MMKTKSILIFFAYLIGEVFWCSEGKSNYTFSCLNLTALNDISNYLSEEMFCDGFPQCNTAEDETIGCDRSGNHSCGQGKFACDGGRCLNISVRCNTIQNCQDGTDEQNCGDQVNVKNCTSEDKYLCKDGLRCLDLEFTCDGRCNCFDCSDENENCSKHDNNLEKKCPRAYFVTANGPQCFCESSGAKSSILCNDVGECSFGFITHSDKLMRCEQRCTQFKTKKRCSCYEDYEALNGTFGSKCRTTKDFAILYANENGIKSLNNTSFKISTILQGVSNCTLLTAANNHVYYTTISQDGKSSIFKKALNSGKPEKLIETDFAVSSIAVDYITNNVYFTGDGSLSVCTNNGEICTQLKCCDVDLVTLAPKSGWMYYMMKLQSDDPQETYCRNKFFLARSNMDGSDEIIHTSQCFGADVFIEMDESRNVINMLERYEDYEDAMSFRRMSVDSDFQVNRNMKSLALLTNEIRRFSFHNDEIFYTSDQAHAIFYFKNMTTSYFSLQDEFSVYFDDNSTSPLTDVHVYNAAVQRSDENPCKNSSCTGLCLLKHEVPQSKYFLSQTCLCDGFTLNKDDPWCSNGSHTVVWVISCITVLIILIVTGYVFKKRNWHRYFY